MCRFLDEFCSFQVSLHAPDPDVWIDNRKPPAKIAAGLVKLSGESYKTSVLILGFGSSPLDPVHRVWGFPIPAPKKRGLLSLSPFMIANLKRCRAANRLYNPAC
jgi:hypothetical protein